MIDIQLFIVLVEDGGLYVVMGWLSVIKVELVVIGNIDFDFFGMFG